MAGSEKLHRAPPIDLTSRRTSALIALAIFLITLCVYWPVHRNEFVAIDDPDYVTLNSRVKEGITREGVLWAFTQAHAGNWHPLTWISHMLDCQWFGLDAGKHHLVNAGFHAMNALLLFL